MGMVTTASGGQSGVGILPNDPQLSRIQQQTHSKPFKAGNGQPLIEKTAKNKRERFPTFGEEKALLRVCVGEGERGRAYLRPIFIVPADTGLQRNELFTLDRFDLDFHRRGINVRAFNAKTNRPRPIPMTQRVYEELL